MGLATSTVVDLGYAGLLAGLALIEFVAQVSSLKLALIGTAFSLLPVSAPIENEPVFKGQIRKCLVFALNNP